MEHNRIIATAAQKPINTLQITLTAKDENNLRIFERQTLREIFGPVNIDSMWRKRNNMEIDKLTEGVDTVRFSKAQRIKWLGHVQRMDQARPTGKLLDWKPMGIRPVGRPRQRWQEDVMKDLNKLIVKNWKETAKDRRTGRDLAKKANTNKRLWCQMMMTIHSRSQRTNHSGKFTQ